LQRKGDDTCAGIWYDVPGFSDVRPLGQIGTDGIRGEEWVWASSLTSRRVALKRFAAGLAGAALATVGFGRNAEAAPPGSSRCLGVCRDAGFREGPYEQCVSDCESCLDHGGTPVGINNGNVICTNGS
jgi:hypothetical protein